MKKKSGITNIHELKGAIRVHQRGTGAGFEVGLKRAGLFLQRESQKLVPVATSDLKNSANTRAEGRGLGTEVFVSYSTEYAVYVHEDLEARHKPGKQAKFLEQPLREKRGKLAQIVKEAIVD